MNHDCGPGRTMMVSRDTKGVTAHCFRCNDTGFINEELTLAERIAALDASRQQDRVAQASPELPLPAERNPQLWPDEARVWLYKAGLSNDRIQSLGFYWNATLRRVVMPVYEQGELVYWQARSLEKGVAKYINPSVDRGTIAPKYGAGDIIVLTEDILSAVKVGTVTEAWSIMGTTLPSPIAMRLVRDGRPVLVMLDPDPAGKKGTLAILKQLRLLGLSVTHYWGRADPKLLSSEEIRTCVLISKQQLQ